MPGLLQILFDRRSVISLLRQRDRIQDTLSLRYRDSLVIHDLHSAVIVIRQRPRSGAGTGQAAGHRDIDDLVILLQQAVPAVQDFTDDRHGCVDLRIPLQMLVKILLREGDVLIVQFVIDIERHRQDGYPQLGCCLLRDPAVAVSKDRDSLSHTRTLH